MQPLIPKELTVCVDSREQNPLLFPESIIWYSGWGRGAVRKILPISVKTATLSAGDYCLEGYDYLALVERKGSLSELEKNLTTQDRRRFDKAVRRLTERAEHRMILLDFSLAEAYRDKYVSNPDFLLDEVFRYAALHRLELMWSGAPKTVSGRKQLGGCVLRWMWNIVWLAWSGQLRVGKEPHGNWDGPSDLRAGGGAGSEAESPAAVGSQVDPPSPPESPDAVRGELEAEAPGAERPPLPSGSHQPVGGN